jgi:uncharacterized membrane protein
MYDDRELEEIAPAVSLMRRVLPWVALAIILWVLVSFMSQFGRDMSTLKAAGETTVTASSGATASVTTTVTGMTATARKELSLLSEAATGTAVVSKARQGSVLTVTARQTSWLKVRDVDGHVGWIPNDAKLVVIKTK